MTWCLLKSFTDGCLRRCHGKLQLLAVRQLQCQVLSDFVGIGVQSCWDILQEHNICSQSGEQHSTSRVWHWTTGLESHGFRYFVDLSSNVGWITSWGRKKSKGIALQLHLWCTTVPTGGVELWPAAEFASLLELTIIKHNPNSKNRWIFCWYFGASIQTGR